MVRRSSPTLCRMKRLVSVYRRKNAYLIHPSTRIDGNGFWVAHQPGVGVSCDADDHVLGQLLLLLRDQSGKSLPRPAPGKAAPLPVADLAGVQSWGVLARSSPTMVEILFEESSTRVERWVMEGRGHVGTGEVTVLAAGAPVTELAAAVRRILREDGDAT